jgi:hypothetical protein
MGAREVAALSSSHHAEIAELLSLERFSYSDACASASSRIGILLCASDCKLMKNQPSSILSRVTVGAITLAVFMAAMAMFIL